MTKKVIKTIGRKIVYGLQDLMYPSCNWLRVMYYKKNFGDAINPWLIKKLTGKETIRVNPEYYDKDHLLCIGSILQLANANSIIWGSGLISENAHCKVKPKQICAVRGPKTRASLKKKKIDCPEIYGDPALLLPFLYTPQKVEKRFKIGIIPHYVDQENEWISSISCPDTTVINILQDDPLKFIDMVMECEKIASSSLHGLILADAYNIPATWIKFSDNLIGGSFKFHDYFLSVNRPFYSPTQIEPRTSIPEILDSFHEYELQIDLKPLLRAFPFEMKLNLQT